MGHTQVSALNEVRASHQRHALRQQLHERFDQWLDEVDTHLPEAEPTLAQVSETIWSLRQALTADVAQTLLEQSHHKERERKSLRCATCDRLLKARPSVSRSARPLVGDLEIARPSFYCRECRRGTYPLDAVLGLRSGHLLHVEYPGQVRCGLKHQILVLVGSRIEPRLRECRQRSPGRGSIAKHPVDRARVRPRSPCRTPAGGVRRRRPGRWSARACRPGASRRGSAWSSVRCRRGRASCGAPSTPTLPGRASRRA